MNVSRQPLLLLLLLEDVVTIPGLFDCNMYKCKRYLSNFHRRTHGSFYSTVQDGNDKKQPRLGGYCNTLLLEPWPKVHGMTIIRGSVESRRIA